MSPKIKIVYLFFFSILFSCANVAVESMDINENVGVFQNETSPNILLIIADDMGLDATPGYGLGVVKPNMPNLQNIIDTGIVFNNVWFNPVCTPNQVIQDYLSRRAKGLVYQGGVNVPMVIAGKGVTRINQKEDALVSTTDLFATISDIAGAGITEINDSKSFKALFASANSTNLYSEKGSEMASNYTIRNTTHKYIFFDDGTEALYNLSTNPLENPNLLNANQLPLSAEDSAIKDDLILKLNEIRL